MRTKTIRTYRDLKSWRDAQGFSQEQAAQHLGLSQSTYSRLERGARWCYGEKAKHIMQETGVPLEVLVGVA